MSDETPVNGENPADSVEARQHALDLRAQSMIVPIYIVAINGLLRTLLGYPLERLMITVAGIMGKTVGEVLSIGDLGPVMKLRHLCAQEFEREMKKVKINPQAPTQTTGVPQATKDLLRKLNG